MTDTVDKVIIESQAKGTDETAAGLKKVEAGLHGITVESDKTEKSTASIENRFKSLERILGTTSGQQQKYEKFQKDINLAVEQNPALQARANDALAAAEARFLGVAKATETSAVATGLARHELVNLSRQFQDVAVSLGSGQSFGTVLLQQGTQIGDVFANSQGNVKGFFGQVASGAAAVLTPMRLVAGGVIGVGAAAAYMALQWDDAQKVAERSLAGIGQRTGTTVADINAFSKANASATGLSITEARNVAIEFTKTGAIAVAGLHGVGEAVHGFATLTGTDATEATKKLASAFSGDLAKGADELNKTYGFLDSATRKQIESLQLQGDRMGAVQVIIDKMAPSNIKAAESVGILTQAWTGFKNVISNIGNLPGQSDQDKLAGLKAQRDAAANTPAVGITPGGFLNTAAAFGGKSAQLSDLDKQISDLQKKLDGLSAEGAAAQLRALSVAGDAVVKSIIPQIEQIDNLERALKTLQDAQNTPGVSRTLGSDDAAVTAIQNQLAALKESQAEAARYNQQVAQISHSWSNVGQAVAMQLQALQNQLPVAQAWTEATRMRAQQQATYNDLIDKGRTSEEASAVAAKQFELSKAAAVANAQKLVQSSEDNLDKIKAQGTEMEGVVASSIAYRDAIQAGATATQAAAIAANTLQASMLQAAQSAQQAGQALIDAENGTKNGILDPSRFPANYSSFTPSVMPKGALGFGFDATSPFASAHNVPGLGPSVLFGMQRDQEAMGISGLAQSAYGNGDILAALTATKGAPNSFGISSADAAFYNVDAQGILGKERSTIGDKISSYDDLVGLQNAKTTDKGTQVSNLQAEMAWLNTLPETIARDQKIVSLQQSIDALKNSTDANTAATSATLNPLYSQGHGALAIGYYKAAGGLDMMAHGPTSGDQIPFHAMVNGGERIQITPPGRSSNDNSRQVINNNNFVFNNASSSNARRSFRQFSQGFGQIAAAGS